MTPHSRPIRVRSEIAAEMAHDLEELRELKQLQARIFQQIKQEKQHEEAEQRRDDFDSLMGLTQTLINLTRQLRAERDALQAQINDENRIVELRRMVDEIAAFASARHASPAAYEDEPASNKRGYASPIGRGAASAERRPVRSAAAHAQPLTPYAPRAPRNAWALRS